MNIGADLASRREFVTRLQEISRRVAFDPATWTDGLAEEIGAIFDQRAPEWSTHESPDYITPLAEALDAEHLAGGICLDVGAGTTIQEIVLADRFDAVVAVDLSAEMLARADPARARLVRADASRLPLSDGAFDLIVCVNMFLFAAEYTRVLSSDGAIVFVSTNGAGTPIYLAPDEIGAALRRNGDARFETTTGTTGQSCWTLARRAPG